MVLIPFQRRNTCTHLLGSC